MFFNLNVLLLIIVGVILILSILVFFNERTPKITAWICFSSVVLFTCFSYSCFMHYSHAKDEKFYKNTNSCVIEVDGVEFSEGQSLMLCSNSGENSLWMDKVGDLSLQTGNDGCYLESSNLDKPLCVCEPKKLKLLKKLYYKLLRKPTKVFHVVNLNDDMTLQEGDSMTILDVLNDRIIISLKYETFKKRDSWWHLKKNTYDRFIFKTDSQKLDTIETKLKRGDNLHHLLTSESGHWILQDKEILEECYLVRDHYTVDNEKDRTPDRAVHLFCGRTILENESIRIFINGQVIDSSPLSTRHLVDNRLFYYGIGKVRNNIWSVNRVDGKVYLKLSNPLRYNFPVDSASGRYSLLLTTNMQEIIDRQGQYDCFYRIFPNQADNSPYAATGVFTYQSDSAHVALSPKFADLSDKDKAQENPIAVNSDGFVLRSVADKNGMANCAGVSYLLNIRDYRTSNHVYQYSHILYCILLIFFAVIFVVVISQSDRDHSEMEKERHSRKIYVETVVYMVLLAFLTIRQIMLWRLQSFPPINNITAYEMNAISDQWSFWIPWIAVFLLLFFRVLLSFSCVKTGMKNNTDKFTAWLKKISAGIKKKKAVRIVCILIGFTVPYFLVFYAGNSIPGLRFLKLSVTVLLFCFTTSILLVKLFDDDDKKPKRLKYVLFITNIIGFAISAFFVEAGLIVPFIGFIGVLCLFMLFYEKQMLQKLLLAVFALVFSFLSFSHLSIAKQISPLIPDHRMSARMEAMVYDPTELFSDPKVQFKGKHAQEILNATSNYWFIDNHNKYRKTLSEEHPDFQPVQEYTQKGVSYITQTRDLVVLRYLNFEHGYLPIILLCVLLFLLFVSIARISRIKENHTKLTCWMPALVALFLLIYSIYLVLVNVNAVVFVGLDFPFLTLTSSTAPVSFILFLFIVIWYFNSSDELSTTVSDSQAGNTGREARKHLKYPVGITILVISLTVVPIIIRNMRATSYPPDYYVSLNQSLVKFIHDNLNPELEKYQEDHKKQFRTSDRKIIDESLRKVVDSLLANKNIFQGYEADSAFIHSVFLKAPSYSDLDYLVYARKYSGHYIFSGNSKYNHMTPIFVGQEREGWHGDLMAADVSDQNLPFINNVAPDMMVFKKDRLMSFGKRNRIEKSIYNLPGRYCYDGQDRLIFRPITKITDERHNEYSDRYVYYTLIPQGDISKKISMRLTCQIQPKDILIVEEGGCSYTVRIGDSEKHYLAKRIHYNGQHETIYPLGSDFVFAASFDKMLNGAYMKQAESNQNGFRSQTDPVRISIDYDLTADLAKYFRKEITEGSGITVTAIDGNGCVRLLGDYNPHALYIDPNNAEQLEELRANALLNDETAAERDALANRNIRWLPYGPGSTIKPVFYAAIASRANLDWPNFRVQANSNKTGSGWTCLGDYSLSGVNEKIRHESSIEIISTSMDVAKFIQTSNNFFLGALLMLGTYPESSLENPNSCLESTSANDEAFPVFMIRNQYYKFKGNFIPELFADLPWETSAVLEMGLHDNFRYEVVAPNWMKKGYDQVTRNKYRMGMVEFLGIQKPHEYVLPETPNLYRQYYVKDSENDILTKHLNIVHGGAPLKTSPLIMAESFLRIALGNKMSDLLTYGDRDTQPYGDFKCAEGYGEKKQQSEAYWNELRETLFEGMWRVIDSPGGTLYKDKNELFKLQKALKDQNIYLYGKTGTCHNDLNHHYAFILANQALHGDNELKKETLKVYVVYFGYYDTKYYNHKNTQSITKEVLSQIIQSETFKKYWYEN